MPDTAPFRVSDLAQNSTTAFDLRSDSGAMRALAARLGLSGLRKLRFTGTIAAQGRRDWVLKATLGATVTQPCVVTLGPVVTRIDTKVHRTYLSNWSEPTTDEVEMVPDETIEPLGSHIDPQAVMAEALALAVPLYPRAADGDLHDTVFTEPGETPMSDADARPFAGLADLRDSLKKGR